MRVFWDISPCSLGVEDRLGGGCVCGLDSTGSGQGPVAACGECGDEPAP
jgi:hypothetical protein